MSARMALVKRERSENLRQDRCCEGELRKNTTGACREGFRSVEPESEDLPVGCVSDSSDKRQICSWQRRLLSFALTEQIGRRTQSVLFFAVLPRAEAACSRRSPCGGELRMCAAVAFSPRSPHIPSIKQNQIQGFSVPCDFFYAGLKGNQVQVLNDPVTVSGEAGRKSPLCFRHEKARPMPKIRKSGNLLKIGCIASEESGLPD